MLRSVILRGGQLTLPAAEVTLFYQNLDFLSIGLGGRARAIQFSVF